MVSGKAVSQQFHLRFFFFFFPESEKGSRFKVDNSIIQKSVQKNGDCWEASGRERPTVAANKRWLK